MTIAGNAVFASPVSGNSFVANYAMGSSDPEGIVPFTIDFNNTIGAPGAQVSETTDGSHVSFDKTAPRVESINREALINNFTIASSLIFRVTFSEPTTNVEANDFLLTELSGSASGPVAAINGISNYQYVLMIDPVLDEGDTRLDLREIGTGIEDADGNAIAGGFNSGETFTLLQSLPLEGFNTITACPGFQLKPLPVKAQSQKYGPIQVSIGWYWVPQKEPIFTGWMVLAGPLI